MKPQGKTNIFKGSNCLNTFQLSGYTNNTLSAEQKHVVELHLIDCDLCSDAVDGFVILPGMVVLDETKAAVNKLTQVHDIRRKKKSIEKWLLAASVIIFLGITFGVYQYLLNNDSTKRLQTESKTLSRPPLFSIEPKEKLTPLLESEKEALVEEKTTPIIKNNRSQNTISAQRPVVAETQMNTSDKEVTTEERNGTGPSPVAATEQIMNDVIETGTVHSLRQENTEDQKDKNSRKEKGAIPVEIVYIEGLKTIINPNHLSEYGSLLEGNNRDVESRIENQPSENKSKTTADNKKPAFSYTNLLTSGIHYFKARRYEKANTFFMELLANDQGDQNALFYSALCNTELNQTEKAKKTLYSFIQNKNNLFFEDAKWNLALVYLKEGNKNDCKRLLDEIINDAGIYSSQAKVKLEEIK